MKRKTILQLFIVIVVLCGSIYNFFQLDKYHFNQVSTIQIEAYIMENEIDFKKYYINITDKDIIKNLVKPLKNWNFERKKEQDNDLHEVNYYIQMNNGFTVSFDSNFSTSSCLATIQNEIIEECVPDEFIKNIKEIIQKEYSKHQ